MGNREMERFWKDDGDFDDGRHHDRDHIGRGVHLAAREHRGGAMVIRLVGLGAHFVVPCPRMSHDQDKDEQAKQQSRLQRSAVQRVAPLLQCRLHDLIVNTAKTVRANIGDFCKSLADTALVPRARAVS